MTSNVERNSFAEVVVARKELETEMIDIEKEEIEEAKELINDEGVDTIIEVPLDHFHKVDGWSILFRSIDHETNKVKYPDPAEIKPLFQEC